MGLFTYSKEWDRANVRIGLPSDRPQKVSLIKRTGQKLPTTRPVRVPKTAEQLRITAEMQLRTKKELAVIKRRNTIAKKKENN